MDYKADKEECTHKWWVSWDGPGKLIKSCKKCSLILASDGYDVDLSTIWKEVTQQ